MDAAQQPGVCGRRREVAAKLGDLESDAAHGERVDEQSRKEDGELAHGRKGSRRIALRGRRDDEGEGGDLGLPATEQEHVQDEEERRKTGAAGSGAAAA